MSGKTETTEKVDKKKSIGKKEFSIDTLKNKFSAKTKYKETQYFDCGEAFHKACGLPGPVTCGISMFLGHSNSSKTTALIKAAADAQKKGQLPVFIITERKWSFDHAKELGFQCEKNTEGEWEGFFFFRDDFDYIEQITDYMNELLTLQEKGELPHSLAFFWDSVGSVPCKMTFEGKGGKMHNASALADKIGLGISGRIAKSKKEDYPYENSLVIVNQPWVDLPDNPFGQPEIKAKGGEAIWLASTLVFLFGNQKKSGISHIMATKDKRKIGFGIRTKVSVLKNHVNGLGYKDGRIVAVPHGYIEDTPEAVDLYKKQYSEFWKEKLGISGGADFSLEEEEGNDFQIFGGTE
jgi:hypothetical protein